MLANLLTATATLFSWWNNPFLTRSFRAEWRGRSPLWAFFGLSALLAAPVAIVVIAATLVGPYGFPERWGGSWGGLAFALVSALHVPLVWRASMAGRRREWIPLESKLGTLELILVSPMSREEVVRKKALYPCCQAMIAALLGLPMYAICWASGGFSLAQIVALYLLFLMIAFRPTLKLPHSILASSARQQVLHYLILALCFLTWASVAAGGSGTAWRAIVSLPLTYANVVSHWLAEPASFFSVTLFPLVLVLVVHAQWFGTSVRLASAQLETTPEPAYEAVAQRRLALMLTLLVLGAGLVWRPFIANGALAAMMGLSVSPGEALCLLLGGLILVVAGAELVERGSTLLSPLTALRVGCGPGFPLWQRTAIGVLHAAATAAILPATWLVCRVLGGPTASVSLPWLAACTLAVTAGLVGCHGMGFLLFALLRRRPRERSGLSLLATAVLAALPALARLSGAAELGWLSALSPIGALIALCPEWVTQLTGTPDGVPAWTVCVAGAVALGLALTGVGYLRLRASTVGPEVADAEQGERERRSERRTTAPRVLDWLQRRWDNPLAVLALRQAGRSGSLVGMAVLGLSIGMAAVAYGLLVAPSLNGAPVPCRGGLGPAELSGFEAAAGLVPLFTGLALALVTAMSAGSSWVDEDRRRTLGFILSTPLSREDIALGRFLGIALPALIGLALTVPFAVVCAIISLSPAAPVLVILGYAWALASIYTCGHLALWMGMGGRSGVDSIGLPLAAFVILGLCRWWYLGAVCEIAALSFTGTMVPIASGGLYLVYLLVEVCVARRARYGAIACVEARRLTEPFGS